MIIKKSSISVMLKVVMMIKVVLVTGIATLKYHDDVVVFEASGEVSLVNEAQ